MAKSVKKPTSRAVVGSTKKSKSMKFTKRMALFSLVGILAFSTIAGMGWQKWQDHQFKAKAAGWSAVFTGSGIGFVQCKTSVSSPYGPLWQITIVVGNGSGQNFNGSYRVLRGGSVVHNVSLYASPGQWITRTTYASQLLGDTYSASYSLPNGVSGTGSGYYSGITTC